MSDDKPKPVDDLKEGLGLLFRAAKGAVEKLPTDKLEDVAKDAVREVGRAFETLGNEIEKVVGKVSGASTPPQQPPAGPTSPPVETEGEGDDPRKDTAPKYDDAYAPPPPKGPRVG